MVNSGRRQQEIAKALVRSEMPLLQTSNLRLSPCCPADRDDFIALERDPEVMLYLNGGYAVQRAESDPDAMFLMPRGTEDYVWTARRRVNSAFVGWFCLWPESENVAELGYRLRRMDWAQGLASEGALALVNWGFKCRRYDKIVACTMAANHASRRVLEKTGLSCARTVQVNWADAILGAADGEVHYELLRQDWKVSRSG